MRANAPHYSQSTTTIKQNVEVGISIDASKSNLIYGNSSTVQPKSLTVRYIIRAK